MKKLLVMLLALTLVFAMVACNPTCEKHVDENKDGKCDVCEAKVECTECVDADDDGKCDVCGKDVEAKEPDDECTEHVDENNDGKCDVCGENMPDKSVMTYAEYLAAEMNSEVTVITYVQAKQSWWFDTEDNTGKGTFYTQAPDGAYFIYEMPMTEEQYNALTPGTCIKVKGFKSEWAGEVEIIDATYEIIDATPFFAEPTDITTDLSAGNDITAKQNSLVSIDHAVVTAAALYKYNGTGSEGDDLYLAVKVGGREYTLVVESYLHANGSEVYEAVEALEAGDVINVEAFLYWYNAAQPHINAVEKVEVMSYADYVAAKMNSEVTVITYVQAKQSWWFDTEDNTGKGTFYTQAPDGAYFIYEMPMTEEQYNALTPGTCIKVNGYKSEWAGEIEIIDATYTILPGTYVAEAIDITADLAAGNDVADKQNILVAINGAVVTEAALYKYNGTGSEGDDLYFKVNVGEKEYTLVVESYLHANGSEIYETVEALEVGDVINVEAFLYWYNAAQPHINKITK